jgi:hypothetical protein
MYRPAFGKPFLPRKMRTNESVAKETAINDRFQRNMDGTRYKDDRPDWLRQEARKAGRPPVSPQRVGEWRIEWKPDEEMMSTLTSKGMRGSFGRIETDIGEVTKEKKVPGVAVRHLGASLLMNSPLTPKRPVWNTVKGLLSTDIQPLDIQPSVIRVGELPHGSSGAFSGAKPSSRHDILRPESGHVRGRGGSGALPSRPQTAGSLRAADVAVRRRVTGSELNAEDRSGTHHRGPLSAMSAASSRPASAIVQRSDAMTLQAVHGKIASLQRPGSAASVTLGGGVGSAETSTRRNGGGGRQGRGERASRGSSRSTATGEDPISFPSGDAL